MLHKLTSEQIPSNTQISKRLVVIVVVDEVLETLIQPEPLLLSGGGGFRIRWLQNLPSV